MGDEVVRVEFLRKRSGGLQKRTFVKVKCAYCKKEKEVRLDAVKEKNYCNPSCSQKDILKSPEDHPNWKGGKRINHNGYIEIRNPEHHRARGNGYVFEHIIALEEKLGRVLKPDEQVHHLDGDKRNNSPNNLIALKIGQHSSVTMDERRAKNVIPCVQCGKKIYRKPFEQKKNKNSFCSRKCLGIWTKNNEKGVFKK